MQPDPKRLAPFGLWREDAEATLRSVVELSARAAPMRRQFRVRGSGFSAFGLGFRVLGLGFRVQGFGFRVRV